MNRHGWFPSKVQKAVRCLIFIGFLGGGPRGGGVPGELRED